MADTVLAAQLYTVRDFMKTPADIAASLKKVKELGYDAVQLSGHGEIDDNDLKAAVDDAGLFVCATHVPFDRLKDETDAMIEYHKLLGCPNPAIGGMPGEFRGSAEGALEFAKQANEVGAKLAAADLRFGYHNHSFELEKFDGKTALDIIFENTDSANLTAEIDTYWIQHGGGDPAAWISKLSGRVPYIHFKDMVINADKEQMFAEIGEGNMNFKAIIAAAQAAGTEWFIVEQDRTERDPFDSLKISLENLKAMGLK